MRSFNFYPDELLYSAIARYGQRNGIQGGRLQLLLFDRYNINRAFTLPNNLALLSKKIGFSIESILSEHTLFPYYTFFLSRSERENVKKEMSGKGSVYRILGLIGCNIPSDSSLRCCPVCIQNDFNEYGEPYWHRIHQLPGVNLCIIHKVRLLSLCPVCEAALYDPTLNHYHVVPTHCVVGHFISDKSEPILDPQMGLFGETSSSLLFMKRLNNLGNEICINKYAHILTKKGLGNSNYSKIYYEQLVQSFNLFYGGFFAFLKIESPEYPKKGWMYSLLKEKRKKYGHPLYHILMINFLGESISTFLKVTSSFNSGNEVVNESLRYRNRTILNDLMSLNPNITRTQINQQMGSKYKWLCRHDKEWVSNILPERVPNTPPNSKLQKNWPERDEQFYKRINIEIEAFTNSARLNAESLKRIIGKSNYDVNLSKLPKTEALIKKVLGSKVEPILNDGVIR